MKLFNFSFQNHLCFSFQSNWYNLSIGTILTYTLRKKRHIEMLQLLWSILGGGFGVIFIIVVILVKNSTIWGCYFESAWNHTWKKNSQVTVEEHLCPASRSWCDRKRELFRCCTCSSSFLCLVGKVPGFSGIYSFWPRGKEMLSLPLSVMEQLQGRGTSATETSRGKKE